MSPADLRQCLHALSGLGAFLLFYLPGAAVVGLLAGGALFAALVGSVRRGRDRQSAPTALHRPRESVWWSGATTYALGVMAAIVLFPAEGAFVGWITLAAGDSASMLAGTRWPVRRLGSTRSLGGLVAFAVAAAAAVAGGLAWWHGGLSAGHAAAAVAVGAVCAVAETFVPRVDDNLFLPSLAAIVYLRAMAP